MNKGGVRNQAYSIANYLNLILSEYGQRQMDSSDSKDKVSLS